VPSSAAAALDELFEHPAGSPSIIENDSFAEPKPGRKQFFFNLLAQIASERRLARPLRL
jgi:hypothetical protein